MNYRDVTYVTLSSVRPPGLVGLLETMGYKVNKVGIRYNVLATFYSER